MKDKEDFPSPLLERIIQPQSKLFFPVKEEYYVICSEQGEVYIRAVGTDNKAIPYYGKYGAMPYEFEGGSRITCFAPFHNVTYWCADEERCIFLECEVHYLQAFRFLRVRFAENPDKSG